MLREGTSSEHFGAWKGKIPGEVMPGRGAVGQFTIYYSWNR
mgnify:CR=1 FL=1